MFRGRTSAPVVAEIGDQEITQEEYRRALSAEFNRLRQMLGGSFDVDQAQALGLPDRVLADLLTRRLYLAEQRELGLIVSEERSEERRVGKECRARWAEEQEEKSIRGST